jgi:lipopolysaccharide transport system permease protein
MFVHPLAQVAIYALILSNVLAAKLPGIDNKYAYSIYLMSGLLAWSLFSDIVSRSLNIFIEQANLIKKLRFPRVVLPVIVLGTNLFGNLLLLLAIFAIFLFLGHGFSLIMLWIVPLTLTLAGFSIGLGLILGVLNVFVRDLAQAVPIILQILFWFTPIVYPETIIPETYRDWLAINPLYHITSAYQAILVYGNEPESSQIFFIAVAASALLVVSLILFRRANNDIVDAI